MPQIHSGGHSHSVKKIMYGYRLSWSYDYKISGSRLRYTRTITRDTDLKGAIRFAMKWDINFPFTETVTKGARG